MSNHKLVTYKVSQIFADYDRNFRDPVLDYSKCLPTEGYDHDKFLAGNATQGMFESVYYNGVLTPIWVAVLTVDQIAEIKNRTGLDYLVRLIRGHKRFYTVTEVNKRFPGKIEELTCDAYTGLSDLEEWTLLADHGPTQREEPLSELGEYRAVINLFAAGFSQEKIANMFGQKRGWSMRRIWVHEMGVSTPIEQHYLARFNPASPKGSYYTFPLSGVDALHKAFNADREANVEPMSDDSGFRKLWDNYAETGKKPTEEKALTRKSIDERASFVKGRPALEELVKFASGRGGNAKSAAEMYDRVNAKAEKAEGLATELEIANVQIGQLTASLESATTELTTVKAELTTVKAELSEARKSLKTANSGRKDRS